MTRDELPSTSQVRRVIISILAAGYGVVLALVAFWPTPIDRPVGGLLARVLRALHERGVPEFFGYTFVEFTANILLFIPVGVVAGLVGRRVHWVPALLAGPILSAVIELIQLLFISARFATIEDIVANTLGASAGVVLAAAARSVIAARDARVIARHEAVLRMHGWPRPDGAWSQGIGAREAGGVGRNTSDGAAPARPSGADPAV